ncbi:MAG: hypothetical protein ACI4VW_02210 [Acutalibacteraceae bacterium]
MKNGFYEYSIEMTVPLGKRRGILELNINDKIAEGFLTMFTNKLPINNGYCCCGRISFVGEMQTLRSTFKYTAEGILNKSRIDLIFNTENGNYSAVGKQIAVKRRTKDIE